MVNKVRPRRTASPYHMTMPPPKFPPTPRRWQRMLQLILLLTLIIGSDQLSKYLAREFLSPSGSSYLSGLVHLSLVKNHGGFLGIVADLPEGMRFLFLTVFVGLLLIASLLFLLHPAGYRSPLWMPLSCITAGGLSNLLDRLHGEGGVTDFLILGYGQLQTGIFNLADVFILIGSFTLGFLLFRGSNDSS
jgi:signal peptidase II